MIFVLVAVGLGLLLFTLGLFQACAQLTPPPPPRRSDTVPGTAPGQVLPTPRLRTDIADLRVRMRTRSVTPPPATWAVSVFPDTEIDEDASRPAIRAAAPAWRPLDRRDDLRLSLDLRPAPARPTSRAA